MSINITQKDLADMLAKAGAFHPLQIVFMACINQVEFGKGQERHGNGKDFLDQPWYELAETHGLGFLTGQAEKKLREAQGFLGSDRDAVERWRKEMYGAIVYASMAVLFQAMNDGDDQAEAESDAKCGACDGHGCGSSDRETREPLTAKEEREIQAAVLQREFMLQFDPLIGEPANHLMRAHFGYAKLFRQVFPGAAWRFNPWTGYRRSPEDMQADPYGHLIDPSPLF